MPSKKNTKRQQQPKAVVVAPQVVVAQPKKRRNRNTKRNGSVKQILEAGGGALATMVGLPSTLGRSLGSGISRIFGQGDYAVNAPQQNSLMTGGPPAFSPLTSGVRIRHREYVQDITSSVGFGSTPFSINPGLNTMFPWLSSVACNFEEYKIHGMVVYLNTTSASSVGSTNTALGLWGVVTQYDPAEPEFTTKQQAENYVGCQTATPAQSLLHGIECKPNSNVLERMYVRTGDVGSEDIKFYDWGKTQVFTQGMQAVSVIGEMWVSYDIEFFKPRLPSGGYKDFTDRYYLVDATSAAPLGSGTKLPYAGSSIGTTLSGGVSINFPASAPLGVYLFAMKVDASTSATMSTPGWGCSGSLVFGPNLFTGNTSQGTFAPQPTTSQRYAMVMGVVQKTKATAGVVTFSGASFGGTAGVDLIVTRINAPVANSAPNLTKLSLTELNTLRALLAQLEGTDILGTLKALKPKAPEPDKISEISISKESVEEF